MRRTIHGLLVLAMLFGGAAVFRRHHRVVLYAQSLPSTKHATWSPNPASQNVTQYVATIDGANPVTVLPASCTATLCTATVSIPTFGSHTLAIVAQNLALSTDPTSLQSSPATTLAFSLNQAPTATSSVNITN